MATTLRTNMVATLLNQLRARPAGLGQLFDAQLPFGFWELLFTFIH
jgi:hypothetical protein